MAETQGALPSPPFIPISNIPNFRTIGAHKSSTTGRITRSDFVYRCGAPTGSDPATISTLQDLKISAFYDLRSAKEIENLKDRMPISEFPGSTRVFAPVFLDRDSSPTALAERLAAYAETGPQGFVRAYAEILDEGKGAYRTIFEHVRDRPLEPLVVHCTAGKDRTGVAVALMLNLVGVDDQVVGDEYELTTMGLRNEVEKWIPIMAQNPAYGGDYEAVRRSLSSRKDSMVETLKMLREKWEGAEGYLRKGLGFEEEEIEKIKENLLQK